MANGLAGGRYDARRRNPLTWTRFLPVRFVSAINQQPPATSYQLISLMRLPERTAREVRHSLRGLRRSPTFTIASLLILSTGIGMATAMFTAFDAVLLKPLPVREPERIVLPRTLDPGGTDVGMTQEELREAVTASHTLGAAAGIAHQGAFTTSVVDGERVLALQAAWVTGNFLELLGVRPALGRFFVPSEEGKPGKPAPVVLSYDTWRRQFNGDSAVIGRRLGNPYTHEQSIIVGVAPAGVAYPVGVEYWTPVVYPILDMVGRLKPGASVAAARMEFLSIMQRIDSVRVANQTAGARLVRADIRTFKQAVVGDVRPQLVALSAAVALLLLIACVNVGNLVLLRTMSRESEIAVRRSLGADAADIVRPLLWECGVLAIGGGVLGLACALLLLRMLTRLAPATLPRLDVLRLSATPFALAAAVTLIALLIAALLPMLAVARGSLAAPLRLDARSGRGTSGRRRLRQVLVASQVALALILVAGAGLLVRSLERLANVPLGYRPAHVSILTLARPVKPDSSQEQFATLYDRVAPEVRAITGITAVTPIVTTPFYGASVFTGRWTAAGETESAANANPTIPFEVGGEDYFRTFDIPLLRGRGFLDTDRATTTPVVVVSRAVAQRFWPGQNPVGKQLKLVGDASANAWHIVVGEAGDIRYRDLRQPVPTIYAPWRQLFFQGVIAIRSTTPLSLLLPPLRRAVHAADPEATIARAETMDGLIDAQLALPRLSTLLLSTFGLAALLLAAVGLYCTMAATVKERTRELGIRAALGATPGRLRANVLSQAAMIAGTGGIAGLLGAFAVSRFLRSQLFDVSPTDPVALIGACVALFGVSLLAAYLPAWRATRVDPAGALRGE
jgi:putative ABC transport system permease protein